MSDTTFELDRVSRTFGDHPALSDVSLSLEPGRHTAVLGPSGCGKSTLLRLLAGLDVPSAGRITMNDKPASEPGHLRIPPHQRRIAMVFQDLALWPNLRVLDNVLLGLSGANLLRREAHRRAEESLDRCGITELSARRPGELSGGQQQRVALARAVAARPDFLFLDEPFAGLDLLTKDYILDHIRDLTETVGFTVVLVTHDPGDAMHVCSHAIVMEQARVVETGALPELMYVGRSSLLRRFQQHPPR